MCKCKQTLRVMMIFLKLLMWKFLAISLNGPLKDTSVITFVWKKYLIHTSYFLKHPFLIYFKQILKTYNYYLDIVGQTSQP